jgi:uncharacterized metal-binding protein YceD (DUF177 family)
MKNTHTQYLIPLHCLPNGEHDFLFTIDHALFDENQCDDIKDAQLKAHIRFTKNSSIFMLNFHITGTINIPCDRCGDNFNLEINIEPRLIVKTGCLVHSEEENMISLTQDENDFDAAPYIYQVVVLSLPMHRIHPGNSGSSCNTETLKKLKEIEVAKSNDEKFIINSNLYFEPLNN